MLARADNLGQLDSQSLGREYLQRAALGKFDFVGPAADVPFRPGCGEVWVAGCPNALYPLRWIQIKPGTCSGESNYAKVASVEEETGETEKVVPEGPEEQGAEVVDVITGGPLAACPSPVEEIQPEPVTPKVAAAAAGVPGLEEDFHRHNHYANFKGAKLGVPDQTGDEKVHDQANASARVSEHDSYAIKGLFVSIAGTSISNEAQTAVAIVAQNGLSREITSLIQVTGIHETAHFFKDAGSVDFANLRATLVERKKQIALAAALEGVRADLEAKDAPDDAKIVGDYIELAQQRAVNLASAACNLAKFAAINAANDEKMKSLGKKLSPSASGQDSGKAAWQSESTISGLGEPERKPSKHLGNLPNTREGELDGKFNKDGILDSFGPPPAEVKSQDPAKNADPLDPEKSLFERVHRKYRQLDERNTFPRSLLD